MILNRIINDLILFYNILLGFNFYYCYFSDNNVFLFDINVVSDIVFLQWYGFVEFLLVYYESILMINI